MDEVLQEIIDDLERLRVDVDLECLYCDPTDMLRQKYEAENYMLDEYIAVVDNHMQNRNLCISLGIGFF